MSFLSHAKTALIGLAAILSAAALFPSPSRAEDLVYVKNARQILSEIKSSTGSETSGELAQQVLRDTVGTPSEKMPVVETNALNQDMIVGGDGKHRGYEILIFRNGDRAYTVYEGTHKVVTKPDGTWEVNYSGSQSITGGTGKYKDLKGKGSYTGHITADSFREENRWNLK